MADANACENIQNVIAMLSKENPKHPALPELLQTMTLLCGKSEI